jgi:hypothetical protein
MIRYFKMLCLATAGGAVIGGLAGSIPFMIETGGIEIGMAGAGAIIGAVVGLAFYSVTHWLVFRRPPWLTAVFLIGGTLIGSMPLSFITDLYSPPFVLVGGALGYWLGVAALLVATWRMPAGTKAEKTMNQVQAQPGNSAGVKQE